MGPADMENSSSSGAAALGNSTPITFKQHAEEVLSKIPSDFAGDYIGDPKIGAIVDLLDAKKIDNAGIEAILKILKKEPGSFADRSKLEFLAEVFYVRLSQPDSWSAVAATNVAHMLHHDLTTVYVIMEDCPNVQPNDPCPHFTGAYEVFMIKLLSICQTEFYYPTSLSSPSWNPTVPKFIARLYMVTCPNFFLHQYLHVLLARLVEAPTLFTKHNLGIFRTVVAIVGERMDSHTECSEALDAVLYGLMGRITEKEPKACEEVISMIFSDRIMGWKA